MMKTITVEFEWKAASIVPGDYHAPILCLTANGKLMTLKNTKSSLGNSHWDWYVEKYNIQYWCYQDELTEF